jgi:hypothetical protein
MFVSVQADETTDIEKLVKYFHGFVQLNDRSVVGIQNCALEPYNLKDKLVSQA